VIKNSVQLAVTPKIFKKWRVVNSYGISFYFLDSLLIFGLNFQIFKGKYCLLFHS